MIGHSASYNRASCSCAWIVLFNMRLHIFINFGPNFGPHMQIIIDLMFTKRLIYLWSLLIKLAVVYIFSMIDRAHVRMLAHATKVGHFLQMLLSELIINENALWTFALLLGAHASLVSRSFHIF